MQLPPAPATSRALDRVEVDPHVLPQQQAADLLNHHDCSQTVVERGFQRGRVGHRDQVIGAGPRSRLVGPLVGDECADAIFLAEFQPPLARGEVGVGLRQDALIVGSMPQRGGERRLRIVIACLELDIAKWVHRRAKLQGVLYDLAVVTPASNNVTIVLEGLRVVDHPVMARAVTELRAASTSRAAFRAAMADASSMLAYEALRDVPTRAVEVQTPLESTTGSHPTPIMVVAVLRAGLGMVDGFLRYVPGASVAHLGMRRNEVTLQPEDYYESLPRASTARPSSSSTRCSPPAAAPRRR